MAAYPEWTQSYPHEDFDRTQSLAILLTKEDREAGRPAPEFGYSAARFDEARKIVRAAHR